jgi:hypothetical protein
VSRTVTVSKWVLEYDFQNLCRSMAFSSFFNSYESLYGLSGKEGEKKNYSLSSTKF